MQTKEPNRLTNNNKRPEIRLPFRQRKRDMGEVAYDHRQALCITFIIFLLSAIVVVSAKIKLSHKRLSNVIYIEMERPEPQIEPQEQKKQEPIDYSDVRNLTSNENATKELNDKLRDDRGTKAEDIYNEAKAVQDRVKSNRDLYEKGLREEQEIADRKNDKSDGTKREDAKVKGLVTVSFSFQNPVRHSSNLITPAYMCEGGGEVVLNVTLNRNGNVSSATPDRSSSTSDNCMITTAINAAKKSRFNIDTSAPEKHQGTITYIFIPQ